MSRLIRMKEVRHRTGLSKSTLYEAIQRGEFPKPVKIGARAVAFEERAVDAWIESRLSAATGEAS